MVYKRSRAVKTRDVVKDEYTDEIVTGALIIIEKLREECHNPSIEELEVIDIIDDMRWCIRCLKHHYEHEIQVWEHECASVTALAGNAIDKMNGYRSQLGLSPMGVPND